MRRALVVVALLASTSAFGVACLLSESDCTYDGSCLGASSANPPDGSDIPDVPTDECLQHPTDPACLDEAKALFVSAAKGDDSSADGTRLKPFKTIGAALAKITSDRRRVYVCAGRYAEDLRLTNAHHGLSLFGGLDCEWAPDPTVKPVIGATAQPVSILEARGVAFADIAVEAENATSGSSIALLIATGELTMRAGSLKAGSGANGDAGVLETFEFPGVAVLNGNVGSVNVGGAERVFEQCPGGGTTIGGAGGNNGSDGRTGAPFYGAGDGGALGPDCTVGSGRRGGGGPSGDAGLGATRLGDLGATGWSPASGLAGAAGRVGQGGGGGAGRNGGGGGSGGAGGCGGAGGGGGGGGGGSVALASFASSVTLTSTSLQASNAGAGGAGVPGQHGQPTGGGGGGAVGGGCTGGDGAGGGNGGSGGGGAGGISVGVLYKGAAPTLDSATKDGIVVGAKGAPGEGSENNPGLDGVAQSVLELK